VNQGGQNIADEIFKHRGVTIKSGNSNAAQAVQDVPFMRILFQVRLVALYAGEGKFGNPLVDSTANLPANSPETLPPEM